MENSDLTTGGGVETLHNFMLVSGSDKGQTV
jgi:hypothetical protein